MTGPESRDDGLAQDPEWTREGAVSPVMKIPHAERAMMIEAEARKRRTPERRCTVVGCTCTLTHGGVDALAAARQPRLTKLAKASSARLAQRFAKRLQHLVADAREGRAAVESLIQTEGTTAELIAMACDLDVPAAAARMAEHATNYVGALVEHAAAVLERDVIVMRWPFAVQWPPRGLLAPPDAIDAGLVAAHYYDAPLVWPAEVAPIDVAAALEWTQDPEALVLARGIRIGEVRLHRGENDGDMIVALPAGPHGQSYLQARGVPTRSVLGFPKWDLTLVALVVLAQQQVEADRRRLSFAVDAGKVHHELLEAQRDAPKSTPKREVANDGRIEIIAPKGCGSVQLCLPGDGLQERLFEAVRSWRGAEGLRHWSAILRLLSIEGARSGRVVWRLDDHLSALGYSDKSRREPTVRAEAIALVRLLTRFQIAVYAPDGQLRIKGHVMTPIYEAERKSATGDEWELEGMTLEIHPLLYSGVRDSKSGTIGRNWYPQSATVPKLDHRKHAPAVALGIILPIRWRWIFGDGRSSVEYRASNVLRLAGIEYAARRAERIWTSLERELDLLCSIGALGSYAWCGPRHRLDSNIELRPPQWAVDRVVHALPPVEPKRVPTTGAELREWRERKGLSQATLAAQLGVTDRTIRNAERATALPPSVAKALAGATGKKAEVAGPKPEKKRKCLARRDTFAAKTPGPRVS
jgi:DNA-binding XRE family transcriptional regulator